MSRSRNEITLTSARNSVVLSQTEGVALSDLLESFVGQTNNTTAVFLGHRLEKIIRVLRDEPESPPDEAAG